MHTFSLRGFVSLLLSFSCLVAAVSGLVLWLVHSPQSAAGPGLILGLGKGVWKSAHIYVSLLMVGAAVFHLGLNWPIYWSYVWQKATRRLNGKRELALALCLTAAVAWTASLGGGGDLQRLLSMSPNDWAKRTGQPVETIVAVLEKEGFSVHNPADSIQEIARHNNVAPTAVFPVLQKQFPQGMGHHH